MRAPESTRKTACSFLRQLIAAAGRIGVFGESEQELEEGVALAAEKSGFGQASGRGNCAGVGGQGWAYDRAERQMRADEFAGPRHDLICVDRVGWIDTVGFLFRRMRERWELRASGQRNGWRVAGFVLPDLEVLDFAAADRSDDSDDFSAGGLWQERIVETGAALLDGCEVEPGGVGDELGFVAADGKVGVGNAGQINEVYDLSKSVAEVRVASAAVTGVPAGVDGKIHQVGEAFCRLVRASGLAAGQVLKATQVHRPPPLGFQIGVDEILMAEFIASVLVDVSGHVFIHREQPVLKGGISEGEFVVLLPKVRFEDFGGRQETENGSVAISQRVVVLFLISAMVRGGSFREQSGGRKQRCAAQADSFQK